MTRDELIRTIAERYSTDPEYPWDDENCIFRHRENRKWFAIAMRVGYRRLGIDREGVADVANVKCGPLLMDAYRKQPGMLPGYHMNKDHWITMRLDGTAEDETIRDLLEISYDLTNSRRRAKRGKESSDPAERRAGEKPEPAMRDHRAAGGDLKDETG